jgi:hypothetical protein
MVRDMDSKDRYAQFEGHTPRPWRWSDAYPATNDRYTWSLIGGGGYGVLSCDGHPNSPQGLCDESNARLIAAAPDLLAENKRLRKALEELVCRSMELMDRTRRIDDLLIRADGGDPAKECEIGELTRIGISLESARAALANTK